MKKTNEKIGTRDYNMHPSSTLQKRGRESFPLAPGVQRDWGLLVLISVWLSKMKEIARG